MVCPILAVVVLNPMNKLGTPAVRRMVLQVFTVISACVMGALFMCLMVYIMEHEQNSRLGCSTDRCKTFDAVFGLYVSSGVFNLFAAVISFVTVVLSSFHP